MRAAGESAGLVLAVPRGTFPGCAEADLVFLPAAEVRGVATASVKKRLGVAGPIEVGVVIVDGRVVGYADFAPGAPSSSVCVVAGLESKAEMAILGAEVVSASHFPLGEDGRTVEYGGRAIPVVSAAHIASHVERLSDSHQAQTPEGS